MWCQISPSSHWCWEIGLQQEELPWSKGGCLGWRSCQCCWPWDSQQWIQEGQLEEPPSWGPETSTEDRGGGALAFSNPATGTLCGRVSYMLGVGYVKPRDGTKIFTLKCKRAWNKIQTEHASLRWKQIFCYRSLYASSQTPEDSPFLSACRKGCSGTSACGSV